MIAVVRSRFPLLLLAVALSWAGRAKAGPYLQCPAPLLTRNATGGSCGQGACTLDQKNPALSTDPGCRNPDDPNFANTCKVQLDPLTGEPSGATTDPTVVCRAITCGDGHATMADGADEFIFGFHDVTNTPESKMMASGYWTNPDDGSVTGAAQFSAPTLVAREGQKLYLTLSNVGFRERPDLTDPHTVHFHGFPNAASVFDGEPMASFGINLGASLTYFYDNHYPGTYMWHCHVEAAEHIQMGMAGNLYILPAQDGTPINYQGRTYQRFAYDDCPTRGTTAPPDPMCGTTGHDVSFFMNLTAFDPVFHDADASYKALDFVHMEDTYAMINGRGYPDTVNPAPILNSQNYPGQQLPAIPFAIDAQGNRSPVQIPHGQKVLLRVSSLSTRDFYTITSLGIPMRVVGQGAQLLRGPTGDNTSYATGSFTLGGGEGMDVLLDTTNVRAGTYFLYTTNLNHLSNDAQDFGGLMTELVVL